MSKEATLRTSGRVQVMAMSIVIGWTAAASAQVSSYQTVRVVDAIINNTDPSLNATDNFTDYESSIAINPMNPREVVVLGFSSGFAPIPNFPLFRSTDSGATWTKIFSVPQPPGIPDAFVNDWTPDHAVMSATKDQLKALPQFKYSDYN